MRIETEGRRDGDDERVRWNKEERAGDLCCVRLD